MKKTKVRKPQKILCYIDYSKNSAYVVDYAYQLSCLIDAELFVLHTVTDIKNAAGFYVPTSTPTSWKRKLSLQRRTRCIPSAARWATM
jgi:hypothetical protein